MQQVVEAIKSVTEDSPEALEDFREAAVKFSAYALKNLRGDLLVRALEVSRSMVEFANFFDQEK